MYASSRIPKDAQRLRHGQKTALRFIFRCVGEWILGGTAKSSRRPRRNCLDHSRLILAADRQQLCQQGVTTKLRCHPESEPMMLNRLLRWIGLGLGGLAVIGIVAYAVMYILSERVLRLTYKLPLATLSIPTDPSAIVEGRRLATIHGCVGACHGREARGAVMFDMPIIGRVVAPNLTVAVRKYNDAQLVAIIRHGVRPDGRSLMVMPAEAFALLNDEDLGRIIAFLKSLPASEGPGPSVSLGPLGRIGVAIGQFKTGAQLIAETVPPPEASNPEAGNGRYLARTICAQCHGTSLRGTSNPDFTSPSLQMVAAYSPAEFVQLMRTGVPLGGRKLPTMGPYARILLSHLTDSETADLYSYLHTLPDASGK
jgi:mono/diheme cytochrome c family protein